MGGRPVLLEDDHVGEPREVRRDRVVELEASFLVQDHRGGRRDRLRHGVDPKDRAHRHRRAALEVLCAHGLEVGDPPVTRDADHAPGDALGRDGALQHLRDLAQGFPVEPHLGERRPRQRLLGAERRRADGSREQRGRQDGRDEAGDPPQAAPRPWLGPPDHGTRRATPPPSHGWGSPITPRPISGGGSTRHHHCVGSSRRRGQTSVSVPAS